MANLLSRLPGKAPFVGVVGLSRLTYDAHFTPAVEAAWRLARPYWGRGYAFEAARAASRTGSTGSASRRSSPYDARRTAARGG